MDNEYNPTEAVPEAVFSSVIGEYFNNPQAHLTSCVTNQISTSGVSGNNNFYRADIEWEGAVSNLSGGSASLLIKRWTPGGISRAEMGWSQPVEALAWRQGILRPTSCPAGLRIPIISSLIHPGGESAWVVMTDVAEELGEFDRSSPLPPQRLMSLTRVILSSLARFHACWEPADKLRYLASMSWMLPFENYLWRQADFYAAIFNKAPLRGFSVATPVSDEDSLNVQTFLEWLQPESRPLFESLLVDRSPLAGRFADIPHTLLHGDLDDRNIGLSWSPSGDGEVVLIDWEWMCCGPAAMDVAKLLIHASMMVEPGSQCPLDCWSHELPDYYYANYRSAGGKLLDYETWQRAYDLALIAQSLWPFPVSIGAVLRTLQGRAPLPKIPGLSEEMTQKLLSSSLENRQTIAASIMQAVYRQFH